MHSYMAGACIEHIVIQMPDRMHESHASQRFIAKRVHVTGVEIPIMSTLCLALQRMHTLI